MLLGQACEKRGRKAGDHRKVEAVFSWNRRTGDFVIHQVASCKGLELSEDKVCITHHVGNDRLLPWGSSVHLYLGDCWVEIPSRGIKTKLMVTTSNQLLMNMADFVDDLEIEGNVLDAKRSHEDDDTSGGESDGTSGAWHRLRVVRKLCPRSADAQELTVDQDHHERMIHTCVHSAESGVAVGLKKLHQVAGRGSCVSKAEWENVCKAANKAISLLLLGQQEF